MSKKIVLRPTSSSSNRRQPLLQTQSSKVGCGEVVGGTTAECIAICCCCPCGLANFLILAVYKLPAGLCRRMLRTRRRRRIVKEGLLPPKRRNCSCGCCDDPRIHPMCVDDDFDLKRLHSSEPDKDAIALEKEMWDRFYSTGFWRSSSRREETQSIASTIASTQTLPKDFQFQLQLVVQQPHSQNNA